MLESTAYEKYVNTKPPSNCFRYEKQQRTVQIITSVSQHI